jgi:FKBP-type peptidyl-prolyl cis-trans isomerase SlyD
LPFLLIEERFRMTEKHTVSVGKVVALHYTLRDDAGTVLDQSQGGDPLYYLHGAENIVPGLESALEGKLAGDKLEVKVAPEDGYGPKAGPGPQAVPRDAFPDDVEIEEGMPFSVENEEGEEIDLWVSRVEGDQVYVDMNHPLAGMTLHFQVEIVSVREATHEEQAHGHPHGPGGGHHH